MLKGIALAALGAALLVAACTTAPVTGRQQFILLPAAQTAAMGVDAYNQIKQQQPIVTGTDRARLVDRIGRDIVAVAQEDIPGDYEWEFTLFENDEPNAFALPGGKVGVNTGLFKVAETENQLAAVMAHEVAHVTARHSAERMSQQQVAQFGAVGVGAATGSQQMAQLAAQAATLGIILPYSRTQESEADSIGLIYMARAGYDPRAAVDLWQNFRNFGGQRPPEFLSTHPAPENRIAKLQRNMDEALAIYRRNRPAG